MNTKLTLSLNAETIERAKAYAQSHDRTLSGMVENYFGTLLHNEPQKALETLPPIVASLAGALRGKKPAAADEYAEYLERKYR